MPTNERRWTDADRETVAAALRQHTGSATRALAMAAAVLDALTAAGWMRGHCPGCGCPDVPSDGAAPTRRLTIGDTDV